MTWDQILARYHRAIESDIGLSAGTLDRPHTMISPEEGRTGSRLAVAYRIGAATVLRCDPSLTDDLASLQDEGSAISLDEISTWSAADGWAVIDGADNRLITRQDLHVDPIPPGATLLELDRDSGDDRSRISQLIDASSEDDVDAAELEMAELDPLICVLTDASGSVGALASARPWSPDSRFDDIGVLTRSDLRGRGWGAAVVGALALRSFELHRLPLYRHDWQRVGSQRLSERLGFRTAARLLAISPPSI